MHLTSVIASAAVAVIALSSGAEAGWGWGGWGGWGGHHYKKKAAVYSGCPKGTVRTWWGWGYHCKKVCPYGTDVWGGCITKSTRSKHCSDGKVWKDWRWGCVTKPVCQDGYKWDGWSAGCVYNYHHKKRVHVVKTHHKGRHGWNKKVEPVVVVNDDDEIIEDMPADDVDDMVEDDGPTEKDQIIDFDDDDDFTTEDEGDSEEEDGDEIFDEFIEIPEDN